MKFKYVVIGYLTLGILLIAGICIWEWNVLRNFQIVYDDEQNRKDIFAELKEENKRQPSASMPVETETTKEPGNDVTEEQTTSDSAGNHTPNNQMEDLIVQDMAALLGVDISQVQQTSIEDEQLSQTAIQCLELYLKHVNGMASLTDLQSIMRTDSKAYKAILSSQQSLEWLIKSKEITFTKEETTDMVSFDENHFACDVNIDLTKKPYTERERTVEESVSYRILFEKINGSWYVYSFMTK